MAETRMQGKTQKEKIKLLNVTLNTNLITIKKRKELSYCVHLSSSMH